MLNNTVESCLLCGGTDARVVCEYPEFTWVRCSCGLIFKRDEAAGPQVAVTDSRCPQPRCAGPAARFGLFPRLHPSGGE